MVKYLQVLMVMIVALFTTNAMAWTPPASPKPAGNIADLAHVLTPLELQRLNLQLKQINTNSANEIGVLIIPSLGDENIRDVGFATAKAWGVGKQGLDNGVMIVWSPGDRKIGIETGSGVEGDLPDLTCNDIIRKVMGPEFKNKNYEAGLSQAFVAISGDIEDHRQALARRDQENAAKSKEAEPQTPPQSGCDVSGVPMTQAGFGSTFFWFILGGGVILWWIRRLRAAQQYKGQENIEGRGRRVDEQRREIKELVATEEALRQEKLQQVSPTTVIAPVMQSPPLPIPVIRTTPDPLVPAVATVDSVSATAEVAARIRQEQEFARREREERHLAEQIQHQADLRREEENRRERARVVEAAKEAAIAAALLAAAAVIESSSDDDDDQDDDSSGSSDASSCGSDSSASADDSDSSDSDFGGGDFSGGGSDDNY